MNVVHDSKGQTICKECGMIYSPMKPIVEAFSVERLMKMKKRPSKTAKKTTKKKTVKKKAAKKKSVKKASRSKKKR